MSPAARKSGVSSDEMSRRPIANLFPGAQRTKHNAAGRGDAVAVQRGVEAAVEERVLAERRHVTETTHFHKRLLRRGAAQHDGSGKSEGGDARHGVCVAGTGRVSRRKGTIQPGGTRAHAVPLATPGR